MNTTYTTTEHKQSSFDLKQEFFKYLPFWYYFVIGLIISMVSINLYLRYQSNIYQSKTIIKLLDDTNSDFKMPTSGVNFFMRSKINIENEKEIIKSNRLIGQVVRELQLFNEFFSEGKIKVSEVYGSSIPSVEWIGNDERISQFSGAWELTYDKNGYFFGTDKKRRSYQTVYLIDNIPMRVIAPISTPSTRKTIILKKITLKQAIVKLKSNIEVSLIGEESELLEISTKGPIVEKNNAVLNKLNEVFDRDGREDKQRVFKKTIDFVNSRFEYLFRELDTIELNKANYKRKERLSFIEGDANSLLATKTESFSEFEKSKTQFLLSEIIFKALDEVKKNELLPANIGLEEMKVNSLIEDYNKIVLESQKIIERAGKNHPSVAKLTDIQDNLKQNIKTSLDTYKEILKIKIQSINNIKGIQENQYAALPYQEKTIRSIERQQKIKETLYLLLLQKREEASINLAITNPSIKIVDEAIAIPTPLSPKRSLFYLIAFVLGLVVPFGLIFVYYLFDTKIHRKEDIERELNGVPILADIPFIEEKSKIVVKNSHSVLSEAFRILVANLNYVLPQKTSAEGIAIFVSSSVKGEGKTFVASNLALSLAALGKKVIILGTDLRNPQLHKALETKKEHLGLVNLLIDDQLVYKDCAVSEAINGVALDIIYSGEIPPNPTEILSNGRLESVMDELKQDYDYVIVDTAPTLLVADTSIITKYAEVSLYLVKANYTEKQILPFIANLKEQNKILNPYIIFNNVGQNEGYGKGYAYSYKYKYNYNYGYGYGYGFNTIQTSTWKKIKLLTTQLFKIKK